MISSDRLSSHYTHINQVYYIATQFSIYKLRLGLRTVTGDQDRLAAKSGVLSGAYQGEPPLATPT